MTIDDRLRSYATAWNAAAPAPPPVPPRPIEPAPVAMTDIRRHPRSPGRLLLAAAVVMLLIGGLAVAAAELLRSQDTTAGRPAAPSASASTQTLTPPDSWAREGDRIRAAKRAASAAPGALPDSSAFGGNAYQSLPINIDHDGTYQLQIPVPANFRFQPPTGVGVNAPPNSGFMVSPVAPFTVDGTGTHRTFHMAIRIFRLYTPYEGFTVWVY